MIYVVFSNVLTVGSKIPLTCNILLNSNNVDQVMFKMLISIEMGLQDLKNDEAFIKNHWILRPDLMLYQLNG